MFLKLGSSSLNSFIMCSHNLFRLHISWQPFYGGLLYGKKPICNHPLWHRHRTALGAWNHINGSQLFIPKKPRKIYRNILKKMWFLCAILSVSCLSCSFLWWEHLNEAVREDIFMKLIQVRKKSWHRVLVLLITIQPIGLYTWCTLDENYFKIRKNTFGCCKVNSQNRPPKYQASMPLFLGPTSRTEE